MDCKSSIFSVSSYFQYVLSYELFWYFIYSCVSVIWLIHFIFFYCGHYFAEATILCYQDLNFSYTLRIHQSFIFRLSSPSSLTFLSEFLPIAIDFFIFLTFRDIQFFFSLPDPIVYCLSFFILQTTILYKLKLGEVVTTIPTIGKINSLLQNTLFFCISSSAF